MKIASFFLILLALVAFISAKSDKADKVEFKRDVKVTTNNNKVEVTSKQRDGDGKTFIQFTLTNKPTIGSRLRIKVKGSDESGVDAKLSSRLRVFEIVEFEPTSEKPVFEEGMDVVQRYTFADKTFGNFVAGKETDGVIPVSTTTSDNRVSVKYELATEIVEKTDYTLSPNSAKFDLEINNFDYKGTASKLAIGYKLDTREAVRQRTTSTEQDEGVVAGEEEAEIETNGMFFSYKKKVRSGSKDVDVTASSIKESTTKDAETKEEGEKTQVVYFTIDDDSQPSSIIWDPKIGVSEAGLNSPASTFVPSIAILALIALFL